MLHECSSYCLREKTIGEGNDKYKSVTCRMHFGTENPEVPARTDGKPARDQPAVVERGGVMHLELQRDHPRLVQGPIRLARAYGANADLQPVLCIRNDTPQIPDGMDVLEYIEIMEALLIEMAQRDSDAKKDIEDLWKEKAVLNSDEYCSRLVDYVVSYACKGEVSSTEALDMFRQIANSSLDGSTPLSTLAQKLNMKLIRSKEMPKAEAVFDLQRLPSFSSSKQTVNVSLNVGHRQVENGENAADDGGNVDAAAIGTVKKNAWDKYIEGKVDGTLGATVTFSSYVKQGGCVPNYLNAHERACWPLTEEYCGTMLMLHKPVSSYAELKGKPSLAFKSAVYSPYLYISAPLLLRCRSTGEHATNVGAFTAFIKNDSATSVVPEGIKRALIRAFKDSHFGKGSSNRGSGNRRDGHAGGAPGNSQAPATPPDPNQPRGDDSGGDEDIEIGDYDMDDIVQQAPPGYDPFPHATVPNVPPRSIYGSSDIALLATFTADLATTYYANAVSGFDIPLATESYADAPTSAWLTMPSNGDFLSPPAAFGTFERGKVYVDPISCINNVGQRILLTGYLDHLEGKGNRGQDVDALRGVVSGVAGTGKSFSMALLRASAMIDTGSAGAVITVAPTGAAAGGIGASTVDRHFRFKRAAANYKELDALRLAELQKRSEGVVLVTIDEFSMWGQNMFGHYLRRLDDCLNNGAAASEEAAVPAFGNLDAHFSFGDPKQLDAVLDPSLSAPAGSSAIKRMGKNGWDANNMFFVLDTPVRQAADGAFVQKLQNLRDGTANGDLGFWAARRLMFLPVHEKAAFGDDCTMHATCYNKDRDTINMEYLRNRNNTIIVRSRCVGTHAIATNHPKAGAAKKIPVTNYMTVGMMVKLVANIIPEYGLYNNARGVVRDIFFTDGDPTYDPSNQSRSPVVMVEFFCYTGPPVSKALAAAGKGKWVPIAALEQRCDCMACHRCGLPLVVAKADSIHSLQGVTIGDTKAIKRLVIHWSQAAEGLWAGIFYVAASRAMESHNVALAFNITTGDLAKIGTGEKWLRQDTEARRLVGLSMGFRLQMEALREEVWHADDSRRWGSAYDFQMKLSRFIERTEAACQVPLPGAPLPRLSHVPVETKAAILACIAQWRASLAAFGQL